MNNQSKKPVIDNEKYEVIKILLKSGESRKKIAEYMKTSRPTVQRIAQSESFEDYKHILKVNNAKRFHKEDPEPVKADAVQPEPQVQVVEHRQTVKIEATHYMMTEMQQTNELLKQISAKLAFIVDELTSSTPVLKEG